MPNSPSELLAGKENSSTAAHYRTRVPFTILFDVYLMPTEHGGHHGLQRLQIECCAGHQIERAWWAANRIWWAAECHAGHQIPIRMARGGWTRPRDVYGIISFRARALENVWGKRFFLVLSFTRAPRTEFGETSDVVVDRSDLLLNAHTPYHST